MLGKALVFCSYALETAVQVVRSPLLSFPLLVVSGCVFLLLVVEAVVQEVQEDTKSYKLLQEEIIIGHLILLTMNRYKSLYFHS